MRFATRIGLFLVAGAAVAAWACNMQPSTESGSSSSQREPQLNPEPGAPTGPAARRPARTPLRVKNSPTPRRRFARMPPPPKGPQAKLPRALPKADKVVAIFHSGNMEGELDPCG